MPFTDEQKQQLPTIYEKIKDVDIAMLTTIDRKRGTLHSRPMSTNKQVEPDGTIWFFTYNDSEKASEVEMHENVNLSYSLPSSQLYVSVSGTAEMVQDKAKMKEFWNPILKAWFPDGLETPNIALLKVTITEAEYWDSNSNKMVQLFQIVRAIVTGTEADYGKHEKIDLNK
ncbi:MAG: general stress protein [Sphingobacteriales bacterium]|nr:MAG: general stress protein [Sphingobacteriales bacterium]